MRGADARGRGEPRPHNSIMRRARRLLEATRVIGFERRAGWKVHATVVGGGVLRLWPHTARAERPHSVAHHQPFVPFVLFVERDHSPFASIGVHLFLPSAVCVM